MANIDCGRGHLYDPEKHAQCPYCNASGQITIQQAPKSSAFSGLKVGNANATAPVAATPVTAPNKTAPVGSVSVTAPNKTAPISGVSVTAPNKTAPIGGISVTAPNRTAPPRAYMEKLETEQAAAQPTPTAPEPPEGFSKPMGFGFGASVADGGKTMSVMQANMGFNPVVGWLVCSEGSNRGKSYSVYGGINSIGRSDRNDITITGDNKISAENHAKISYSDKNNRFRIISGDGRNIIYLNDEEVFSPEPLNAYDLIDFGDTKLIFIPLCSDKFIWTKGGA